MDDIDFFLWADNPDAFQPERFSQRSVQAKDQCEVGRASDLYPVMDSSFALIVAAAGTAAAWQARRWRHGRRPRRRLRQSLLKPGDRYFYSVLKEAAGDFSIQVAVDASRVLCGDSRGGRRGRAGSESVIDFLLCDPETLQPTAAVLLSRSGGEGTGAGADAARQRLRRQLTAAGLPCFLFDGETEYEVEAVSEELAELVEAE